MQFLTDYDCPKVLLLFVVSIVVGFGITQLLDKTFFAVPRLVEFRSISSTNSLRLILGVSWVSWARLSLIDRPLFVYSSSKLP